MHFSALNLGNRCLMSKTSEYEIEGQRLQFFASNDLQLIRTVDIISTSSTSITSILRAAEAGLFLTSLSDGKARAHSGRSNGDHDDTSQEKACGSNKDDKNNNLR